MIPCDVVIPHTEYSVIPRKYRLSNTFCGSAYHVSRAGDAGAPAARPRPPPPPPAARPAPPARGAGAFASCSAPLHVVSNTPCQSEPAAARAASTCLNAAGETPAGGAVGTAPVGRPCAKTEARRQKTELRTEPRTRPPTRKALRRGPP